jgi:endoglucanase
VRELISAAWQPLTDELSTSRMGSLHGLKRARPPQEETRPPSILLAAHMDAIGLMVAGIVGEFLRLSPIGGLDPRVLPGQSVVVHGREELPGLIVLPPARFLPPDLWEGSVPIKYLLVDTGLPAEQLKRQVRIGDLISFAQQPLELRAETLAGHSLDNRASVAAVTLCLEALQSRNHAWDVWAVATVQEETNLAGASTSAFQLQPSLAVAIDVTWAKGPGTPDHKTFAMGKGPALGWGPNIHAGLFRSFRDLADRLEIPYQIEVIPLHSGTDAYSMQVVAEGIPTMVVSIPLRYMHTPVELVSLKDVTRAGHLLAEFIAQLEPDYLEKLSWD